MSGRLEASGWTLEEAIARTVDPDILAACDRAEKSWRDAGAPTHTLLILGSDPETQQSFAQHNEGRRLHQAAINADQRRANELCGHLFFHRLIAWGRRESPVAPAISIPPSAWNTLKFDDLRGSIVSEPTTAKVRIFDVQVFPVVEAPDAIEHLARRSFVDALCSFVLADPELLAMRKHAVAAGGEPATFGYTAEPERIVWPLSYGRASAWKAAVAGAVEEPKIAHVRAADQILERRFSCLVDYLRSGALVAEGIPADGSSSVSIPRSFFERQRAFVDLENGDVWDGCPAARSVYDVLAEEEEAPTRLRTPDPHIELSRLVFMGMMLRSSTAEVFHMKPPKPHSVRSSTITSQPVRITAQRASIAEAIKAIWPEGIPTGVAPKARDQKIIQWQKDNGRAIASSKTIRRYLAEQKTPGDSGLDCPAMDRVV